MATKIRKLNKVNLKPNKLPLVIGYFGCIHIMHAKLFKKYQKFNVLTFNDFKKKQQSQLYSFDQRIKNIAAFSPSYIYIYDIAKGNITGQAFIKKHLIPLAPSKIVVGSDFKFGCDNCGVSLLRKYFDVSTIDYNKKISTTIIKKLLLGNKIEKANSYLYEPYHYIGKWVDGAGRGRKQGYPTINLKVDNKLFLKDGSYVTKTKVGSTTYKSITFVGRSKTFNNKNLIIESYLIDKKIKARKLYPSHIRNNIEVEFLKFIRQNERFANKKDLIKAIAKDLAKAKAYFKTIK